MTCRCTVPPRGPTDSMIGARNCPNHPAPRIPPTADEMAEIEQDLGRRVHWGRQRRAPDLPPADTMRWAPGDGTYRPSDFDTPPHVRRRPERTP